MSLTNLHFLSDFDGGLASVEVNGIKRILPMSSLREYWGYAEKDEIEGGHIQICGNYVLGFILVAGGQGGIVFIWDPELDRITHVSDASYSIAVTMDDQYVYTLSEVTGWGSSSEVIVCQNRRGILDAFSEGEAMKCDPPISLEGYAGDYESIHIQINSGVLSVDLNGNCQRSNLTK